MQFTARKRRPPPAVIIVSLIDVLIVVLIFLIVTTTFKQQPQPAIKLAESKQAQAGASEKGRSLTIDIPAQGLLLFENHPMSAEQIQQKLAEQVRTNPQVALFIRADAKAPFEQIVKVMDAAKAANIKTVSAFTKKSGP